MGIHAAPYLNSKWAANSPATMVIIKITAGWLLASSSRVGASADKEAP
jgi:hypothetical protein